ncbi:MAG: hypothetical protein IKV41_01250 [Oscillospiraceae bacterium]|nr:hypothetical protein [Oscillospiraceae bacterium]
MKNRKVYGRKTEYSSKLTVLVCLGVAALLGIIIGVCFLLDEPEESTPSSETPQKQAAFYPQDYYPENLSDNEIAFMANGEIVLSSGQKSLPLYFEYPAVNNSIVVIELFNEKELLYKSSEIHPGSLIEHIQLEKAPAAGEYKLKLHIAAFSEDGGDVQGTADEYIRLTVTEKE